MLIFSTEGTKEISAVTAKSIDDIAELKTLPEET